MNPHNHIFVEIFVYLLLHCNKTKKICKQNWKEMDSWCTNKQFGLFNHRQRYASIDQEKKLFLKTCPCVSWPISNLSLSFMCIHSSGP